MRETKQRNGFSRLIAVLGLTGLTCLGAATFGVNDALALTALRQVQVSDGSRVDLLFDGKVSRSQIKTEFLRDIIQISLNGVSVYPAKISSVTGGPLSKIFAYQYSPKLVRCRLTVNGKAESYKNKVTVISGGPGGTLLTIRIGSASGEPTHARSAAINSESTPIIHDASERALLNQVMKTKDAAPAAGSGSTTTTDTITEKSAAPAGAGANAGSGASIANTENRPLNLDSARERHGNRLGGAGEFPSPLSTFGKLALVIALFGAIAVVVKKIWKPGEQNSSDSRLLGAIGRFARKNLGANLGSKKIGIEILANHHLGPKKSIAVIRISGRTLVVGITEQSINLISQLSSEEDTLSALAELDNPPLDDAIGANRTAAPPITGTSASTAGSAIFSKLLQSETAKPATGTPVASTRLAATTARRDVRVTSYGSNSGGSGSATNVVTPPASGAPTTVGTAADSGVSAQAAMSLSGVRAQIRSKLEGLKQI